LISYWEGGQYHIIVNMRIPNRQGHIGLIILFICLLPVLPNELFSQIPSQPGWPVEVTNNDTGSLLIADFNDDGTKEILGMGKTNTFQDKYLYMFNPDGTILPGFPVISDAYRVGNPIAFDSDDDGTLEFVISYDGLHMFDFQGNERWYIPHDGPIFQSNYVPYNLAAADLTQDGKQEIIVTCTDGGGIFVFDSDGNLLPGWPVVISALPGWTPPGMNYSATIGDLNGDGELQIIVVTVQGHIICLKPNGQFCPDFPILYSAPGAIEKPILFDLTGDGKLEILISNRGEDEVWILDYMGNQLNTLPLIATEMSFGDPNQDGIMDLGFRAQGGYHLIETSTFTDLPGFPINLSGTPWENWAFRRANFVDLTGNVQQELLFGSSYSSFVPDGQMMAFDLNGSMIQDFPIGPLYHRSTGGAFSTINDLDGDGDVEFCIGSDNSEYIIPRGSTVYCWDSPQPYNLDNIDWAMEGFDMRHTGRWRKLYHIDRTNSHLAFPDCSSNPCVLSADGSLHDVVITATRQADGTHPSGQDVRYSRTPGCGEYVGPVLDNGDGTYTRQLQAPSSDCTTGLHAWVNEFKLDESVTIHFVDCTADLGDVNLNGSISSLDAVLILQKVVGMISFNDDEYCRADVNENGTITSLDAAYVLMCTAGNCTSLPTINFQAACQNHGNCI